MLVYSHKKDFIGIDENDLKALGFSNLAELLSEAADFADLFVKSVGYIHNFKHVHWIDYLACDDSGIKQKVIIRAKNKNYTASLDIQTIYLHDNPSQKAYIINLLNIKALFDSQNEQIKMEPAPQTAKPVKAQPIDSYDSHKPDLNIDNDSYMKVNENISLPVDIDINSLKLEDIDKSEISDTIHSYEPKAPKQPIHESKQIIQSDDDNNEYANYKYSPKASSEALGLPVDLIEEFIQDFISQAYSFKTELYQAVHNKDMDKLKMLAHKLKGVAANLRIENALSILTSIGSVNENDNIEMILDKLFKALDRLSDKETHNIPSAQTEIKDKTSPEADDDDFVLSFKYEDPLTIESTKTEEKAMDISDDQVPDIIEIAELYDDDFYKQHEKITQNSIDDEELLFLKDDYNTKEEASNISISYDKRLIAESIGLDADSFNKLFEEYLETSRQICENIVESIENGNFNSFKEDAIELKGMSNNMRIHQFDDELDAIISSNNSQEIEKNINIIMIKINQISNTEGK